jgi:hypothetical protein
VHEAQWQWRSTLERRACHLAAVEGGGGGVELGVVVGGGGGTIAISDHRREGAAVRWRWCRLGHGRVWVVGGGRGGSRRR